VTCANRICPSSFPSCLKPSIAILRYAAGRCDVRSRCKLVLAVVARAHQFSCEDVEEGAAAVSSGSVSSTIYDIKGAGLKRIGLNVAALQEREAACRMLFEFASNLENEFMPYVEGRPVGRFELVDPLY
jgi:hypothetical protein